MRLLQVITDTDRRGAQVFAVDLGDALAERGNDVTNVALQAGTTAALLDVWHLASRGRSPKALLRLRRLMRAADVTIAHGSSTLLACAIAGSGARRPFVYRQISDPLFWSHSRMRQARVRLFLARATAVTALSAPTRDVLVERFGIPPSKVTVIPNGVCGRRFHPPDEQERSDARLGRHLTDGQFTALYVGALVAEKGVDIAIEAVGRTTDTTLLVVGDGPRRADLQALADRAAPGRVRFTGSVSDVVALYHAADAVVMPSLGGDSMPAALIESGLCGLPAVCTQIGASTDVVVDRRTGLVVGAGDVAALVEALNRLSADRPLRRRMGAAALVHCRANFEIQSVADRWMALLQQFAGRNGYRRA